MPNREPDTTVELPSFQLCTNPQKNKGGGDCPLGRLGDDLIRGCAKTDRHGPIIEFDN